MYEAFRQHFQIDLARILISVSKNFAVISLTFFDSRRLMRLAVRMRSTRAKSTSHGFAGKYVQMLSMINK